MKEGLLSVIILTKEDSSLVIRRAIQSVREQKYQNYEIILVDANEEDSDYSRGLREDMEHYPDLQLVSCPCRCGELAAVKNRGAETARGEYLGYLMASDAWNADYAAKQIEVLREEKDTGLVFCRSWALEEDAVSTEYRNPPLCSFGKERSTAHETLFGESFLSISQIMIRSDIFYKLQGFDLNLRGEEDYDLWLRISENSQIAEIKENLVCRYTDKEAPYSPSGASEVTGYLQLYSKHKNMFDSNPWRRLVLYKKIVRCCKNSGCYWRWLRYILKVKRLEKKVRTNQK